MLLGIDGGGTKTDALLTDNEGNVVVAEGQTLTDAEILAITWFCEGITVN